MTKNLLIFSQAITGHNIEYLEYLYLKLQNTNIPAIFVTPTAIDNSTVLKQSGNIKIRNLNSDLITEDKEKLTKSLNEICVKEDVSHIFFMQLDILLIPLFLKVNKTCSLSAIYFEHFVRYQLIRQWRYWARGIRYITPLAYNKRVKRIYILNDNSGTHFLNKLYFKFNKFKFLPDPIDLSDISTTQNLEFNIRKKYCLGDKKIITCIGSLDERKNTVNVIKAFSQIPEEQIKNLALAVFGIAKEQEDSRIKKAIIELKKTNKDITIIYENKRLTTKEFNDVIFQSDILAIPYSGHVGSSGILGNAVKYKKKVIGSKTGLTGKLIKRYKLGELVNEKSVIDISKSILKLLSTGKSDSLYSNYLLDIKPTPEHFSKIILNQNF